MDQFGNYIVQKALQNAEQKEFDIIIDIIKNNGKKLKQSQHGKVVYEKLMKSYKKYLVDDKSEKGEGKISININTKDFIEAYEENEEEEENIICPDLPFFTVDTKNSILMGDYNESDTFTLFIVGTLTNGYYTFKNGTRVALAQTYKDIKFDLIVQDNFLDSEDKDVSINCVLKSGTLYEDDDEAVIKCTLL